jgi:hypothetical protein
MADSKPAVQPGASQPKDQQDSSEPSRAELEKQLAELQEKLRGEDSPATVSMKVEGPHATFSYGGVTVGTEPTEVPATHASAITTAASEAGVTITQES